MDGSTDYVHECVSMVHVDNGVNLDLLVFPFLVYLFIFSNRLVLVMVVVDQSVYILEDIGFIRKCCKRIQSKIIIIFLQFLKKMGRTSGPNSFRSKGFVIVFRSMWNSSEELVKFI